MLKSKVAREIVWLLSILASAAGLVVAYKLTVKHVEHEFKAAVAAAQPAEPEEEATAAAIDLSAPAATQPASGETGNGDFLDEICTEAPEADCEEASASQWGTIRLGQMSFPTSQLGGIFFFCMLCWQLAIGDVSPSRAWVHWIYLLGAAAGLLASVYFEVIMWTQLESWCPLCLFTHVMTLLLLIFAIMLRVPRPPAVLPPEAENQGEPGSPAAMRETSQGWPNARALLVVALLAAVGSITLNSQRLLLRSQYEIRFLRDRVETPKDAYKKLAREYTELKRDFQNYKSENTDEKYEQIEKVRDYYKKQAQELRLQYSHWYHSWVAYQLAPPLWINMEDRPAVGPEDAKYVVTIFSDFQCPVCAKFEKTIGKTLLERARKMGDVRVVFIEWPICIDCNPTSTNNLHPLACKAAYAAEAAYQLGGNEAFWKMHEILYDRQKEWTQKDPPPFVAYAKEIGLDPEAFEQTMNSDAVRESVKEQVREGMDLGKLEGIEEKQRDYLKVESTPTIFVNNKRMVTWGQTKVWELVLQSKFRPLTTKPEPATAPAAPEN